MSEKSNKGLVKKRRDAAEEVCWKALIMMGLGELDLIPLDLRGILGDPMKKWADLAQESGMMKSEDDGKTGLSKPEYDALYTFMDDLEDPRIHRILNKLLDYEIQVVSSQYP